MTQSLHSRNICYGHYWLAIGISDPEKPLRLYHFRNQGFSREFSYGLGKLNLLVLRFLPFRTLPNLFSSRLTTLNLVSGKSLSVNRVFRQLWPLEFLCAWAWWVWVCRGGKAENKGRFQRQSKHQNQVEVSSGLQSNVLGRKVESGKESTAGCKVEVPGWRAK